MGVGGNLLWNFKVSLPQQPRPERLTRFFWELPSSCSVYPDARPSAVFPTTVFLAYLAIQGENITVGRKFLLKSQTKRRKTRAKGKKFKKKEKERESL